MRCSLFVVCCSLLVVSMYVFCVGCSLFDCVFRVVCFWRSLSFVVGCCVLFGVCCLLSVVCYCAVFVVCCLLFVDCSCSSFGVCSLCIGGCLLCVACCFLFVVSCLFVVV